MKMEVRTAFHQVEQLVPELLAGRVKGLQRVHVHAQLVGAVALTHPS